MFPINHRDKEPSIIGNGPNTDVGVTPIPGKDNLVGSSGCAVIKHLRLLPQYTEQVESRSDEETNRISAFWMKIENSSVLMMSLSTQ